MKKILIIVLIAFFVFLTSHIFNSWSNEEATLFPTPSYKSEKIKINNHTFLVYIADDDIKRSRGLSNINAMPEDQGMLFRYTNPDLYQFWMKDMKISLDFIYLNGNEIVDVQQNISPDTFPKSFTSKSPADEIIEFNEGVIKKYGIQKGMKVIKL